MTLTRVAIFAGTHWTVGMLNTEGRRLNELANDRTSDFLSLVEPPENRRMYLQRKLAFAMFVTVPGAHITGKLLLGGADVAAVVLIAKQALTGCHIGESPVE